MKNIQKTMQNKINFNNILQIQKKYRKEKLKFFKEFVKLKIEFYLFLINKIEIRTKNQYLFKIKENLLKKKINK